MKYRLTYQEHSEEQIVAAIKEACPKGGVFADWLTETCLLPVVGVDEFQRGIIEGQRRLAGTILDISRSESK